MSEKTARSLSPIGTGICLSIIVVLGFLMMGRQQRCELVDLSRLECLSNLEWFLESPPNEIGDALAGFSGALAFIWLVVAVWLQSKELGLQRNEIRLARIEQARIAETLSRQTELLTEQQVSLRASNVDKLIDWALRGLVEKIVLKPPHELYWQTSPLWTTKSGDKGIGMFTIMSSNEAATIDETIKIWTRSLDTTIHLLLGFEATKFMVRPPYSSRLRLQRIDEMIGTILKSRDDLSSDVRVRIAAAHLENASSSLNELLSREDLWEPEDNET